MMESSFGFRHKLMKFLSIVALSVEGFTIPSQPTTISAFQRLSIPSTSTVLLSSATEELAPGIKAIDEFNQGLEIELNALREKPYFRLYSVDMLGSCEYIPQELFECYSETCEIYPVEEEDVSYLLLLTRFFFTIYLTSSP